MFGFNCRKLITDETVTFEEDFEKPDVLTPGCIFSRRTEEPVRTKIKCVRGIRTGDRKGYYEDGTLRFEVKGNRRTDVIYYERYDFGNVINKRVVKAVRKEGFTDFEILDYCVPSRRMDSRVGFYRYWNWSNCCCGRMWGFEVLVSNAVGILGVYSQYGCNFDACCEDGGPINSELYRLTRSEKRTLIKKEETFVPSAEFSDWMKSGNFEDRAITVLEGIRYTNTKSNGKPYRLRKI